MFTPLQIGGVKTTTNKQDGSAVASKTAPALRPDQIRTRKRPNAGEVLSEIVCSQDLGGMRLLNAALRSWELRNGFAVLVASAMFAVGSINAQSVEVYTDNASAITAERIAAGKVSDDEAPFGPYVSAALQPVAREVMNVEEFFGAYPDADAEDYEAYLLDEQAWTAADAASAYFRGDVDGGSAGGN
jgi:hypothetical protein